MSLYEFSRSTRRGKWLSFVGEDGFPGFLRRALHPERLLEEYPPPRSPPPSGVLTPKEEILAECRRSSTNFGWLTARFLYIAVENWPDTFASTGRSDLVGVLETQLDVNFVLRMETLRRDLEVCLERAGNSLLPEERTRLRDLPGANVTQRSPTPSYYRDDPSLADLVYTRDRALFEAFGYSSSPGEAVE